jgi:type I restriction enzyme M protein
VQRFKHETFWGREKENLIYPIGLANLILHGIDRPNIWHGNALTGDEVYGGLFQGAPTQFDVILTNPPFGGKESASAQTNFDYRTSATQVLFMQHFIRSLRHGGRCGVVIDEGVLFRTNEDAFVKTKRKLTDECDLWCVLSLPGGVFSAAGAGVKTNLLFFTKGKANGEDLVLRPVGREGRQEDPADPEALRGLRGDAGDEGGLRAVVDRGPDGAKGQGRGRCPAVQGPGPREIR